MITLQVAALKRNLQLEEMRQFRQMSRPSFQLKPREIIDQDEENSSKATSFLDVNEEWYTSTTQPTSIVSFAT